MTLLIFQIAISKNFQKLKKKKFIFIVNLRNLDYYGQIALSEAKLEKDSTHDEIKVSNFELLKNFYQKLSESWSVVFDILVKLVKSILDKDQQGNINFIYNQKR